MTWESSSVLNAVLHKAEAGNVAGLEINVSGVGLLSLHVVAADSWDGTVTFQASIDESNRVSIQGVRINNGSLTTTGTGTTLNMIYQFDVSGVDFFRALISGRTTGSVTATARGVPL